MSPTSHPAPPLPHLDKGKQREERPVMHHPPILCVLWNQARHKDLARWCLLPQSEVLHFSACLHVQRPHKVSAFLVLIIFECSSLPRVRSRSAKALEHSLHQYYNSTWLSCNSKIMCTDPSERQSLVQIKKCSREGSGSSERNQHFKRGLRGCRRENTDLWVEI